MLQMGLSKKSSSYRGNSNYSEFEGVGHDSERSRRKQSSQTNAFGEIEFTGLNQSAKYVRLSHTTSELSIQNILQTKWGLSHPTLVISIFGGNFEKKRKLKMIIKKGLWKAAESAGCWIVTEGLNMGIMKLAGDAVRDYTDAYGGNKMIAIGVAPWNRVARNEILEQALNQGNYPAIYQAEEETDNNDENNAVKEKRNEKSLDANHSHFFLYDCPPLKTTKISDVQFRTQLEQAVSLWKTSTSDYGEPTEIRVPICGLLVGGDLATLKQVFNSMIENKCPIVVCSGSSGAADVLALALDACQKLEEENNEDIENVPLEVRLERIIRECLYKINPEVHDFKKESLQLKEIVTNLSYLISVFDMEEDWDLDRYIISSLLSSAGSDISQNQLNLEQLEITLTLNRADIAKEKIFLENKKWKKGDLNDYMFNALMSDRHDFVKLFLEQGFSLEEFLTVYILEKLYTEQLKNLKSVKNSRIEIFHQLWEHHKTHRLVQNVKLREVGKVIRILVGDFYHPLYLSKEFQNLLLKTSSPENPLKTNRSYEQVMKANLKANAFNEYKMFVLSLHPHSKSLLHLNYIDQTDIDYSDRRLLMEGRGNHSYANKSMEDAKCDTMTTMLPPSLTSLVPKHNKVEKLFNRIISVNKNYEDIINLHYKARTHNQCHRRASSLDMIDILNNRKLNQVSTSGKMKPNDYDTMSFENQIDEQEMRRLFQLNFNDSDPTRQGDHKFSVSTTGSRGSFLKYRSDNDTKLKEISLERPARELMIWSLLVGKLQMAELFWTMEKEQIAGALLASMLLNSLASKTDDFTDKEDYKNYSRHFEGQAEGVLNECYIEDEKRAQLLINKELKYYGQSSVILLAAQGQSIKFMAHPCCQDFLTNTWYGNLSSKNSAVRILGSVGLGLTIPFIIPKVMTYREDEAGQNNQENNLMIMDAEKEDIENGNLKKPRKSKFLWLSKHQNSELVKYFHKLKSFYFSPIIRFIYNAVSYLTFLLLFSTFLLFKFKVEFVPEEVILIFWIGTLLLEEIKQIFSATLSGISFKTYFSDGWNKLDSLGITLFVSGFVLRLITYVRNQDSLSDLNQQYRIILTDPLFIGAQTCMGCSLFFFYVRVMYIFSFHISLGPKLIMIRKMISNDLIPFMIILSVFMIAYGVASYANAYPLGLQFSDDMLKNSSSKFITHSATSMIMTIILKSYYPMFGDFGLDSIQGTTQSFNPLEPPMVPTKISRTLIPLFLGLHVLLTNVLLFNLLIAMFTKTYEEIESSSVYYWNYQRYQMISEFVNKSPLVPPVIIFWHFYELYFLLKRKLFLNQDVRVFKINPFCLNFSEDLKKERELVKWEHMKAMDYIRKINEPTQKSRQSRGADRSVFRGFGGAGGAGGALSPQMADNKPDLTGLIEEVNHQLDKRFKEVEVKFGKLGELESQITGLCNTIKDLGSTFTDIKKTQNEINDKIESFPKCQCLEMVKVSNVETPVNEEVTKLEMAVRSAILSLKSEFQPVAKEIIVTPASSKVEIEESDADDPISFVSNDDTGDIKKDPFFAPQVEDPSTGRLVERVVNNHRIWRYLPFNFELYPGMRMKVPNSMVSWQVPYSDYNAFDASEEVLVYPNEHCRDANDPAKYRDSYNSYDQANKVKRQSMLGQYAIDPVTNAPLNPTGRTGLKGRGLLPHWGPNHTIIILFTRWFRTATGSPILQKNKKVMQYIGLERANRFGIPWFLVDHTHGCDMNVCSNKTTMAFLDQRLEAQFSNRKLQFIRKKLQSATCTQIFKGFLDDHLNADNAWIETFVINFHESENSLFTDDFLKIFIEPNSEETVKWLELSHSINLRNSHDMILKIVSQKNNAYF